MSFSLNIALIFLLIPKSKFILSLLLEIANTYFENMIHATLCVTIKEIICCLIIVRKKSYLQIITEKVSELWAPDSVEFFAVFKIYNFKSQLLNLINGAQKQKKHVS